MFAIFLINTDKTLKNHLSFHIYCTELFSTIDISYYPKIIVFSDKTNNQISLYTTAIQIRPYTLDFAPYKHIPLCQLIKSFPSHGVGK